MIKRLFDIIVSLLGLLLLLPMLGIIALLVLYDLGRPVLFCQVRSGKGEKPFKMIKFRTMHTSVDQYGNLLPDAERTTAFGAILRGSSLDELPELFNVLIGDMSLVGPRPLLTEYLALYSPFQQRRHELRPGITGWAQVNGRNTITWEEKFKLDVWYVDNYNFWLDIKIIYLTISKVLLKSEMSADGDVTVSKYMGDKK